MTRRHYKPLDDILFRTPLRPIERYLELDQCSTPDAGEHLAIAIASESMAQALTRDTKDDKSASRLHSRLLRYLIRMTVRSTPFGMFAGVALAKAGAHTDVALSVDEPPRTRTRCDVVGVFSLVWALESISAIMAELAVVMSSAAFVRGDRLTLSGVDRAPSPAVDRPVEMRATVVVRRVLERASAPIRYSELKQELLATTPNASIEKVERFLRELWKYGYLVTDLRPPLTGSDPLGYVIERLATIPAATNIREQLARFQASLAAWDETPGKSVMSYRRLVDETKRLTGGESSSLLQVDSALALSGVEINRRVADEAVRAAELLLRMTLRPSGPLYLAGYREAFLARYEHHRAVPLLELIDAETGLGPPDFDAVADPPRSRRRDDKLIELATRALHDRARTIELDEPTIAALETYAYSSRTAPVSFDIYAQIASKSAADIDNGDFRIIVGPNLGAMGAGRNTGRFFDVLPEAEPNLHKLARLEESLVPDAIVAGLVYRPPTLRVANVVISPAVRRFELGVTVTAREASVNSIPLEELHVCVERGRFMLRWFHEGIDQGEVIVVSGHMLNPGGAPAICRFLSDVVHDGRALLSWFDWGRADRFPFLPRVVSGRAVLRLAQWRIVKSQIGKTVAHRDRWKQHIDQLRERWAVPRYVYANREGGLPDNRLLLDLDSEAHVELARELLNERQVGDSLILQEGLPGPDDAWVQGPSGRYMNELVVSAVRNEAEARAPSVWQSGVRRAPTPRTTRLYPPGTEWLTVQLYGSGAQEIALIADMLLPFAEQMESSGKVEAWMFLRYADPAAHVRLRFRGEAQRMNDVVVPAVCAWAAALVRAELVDSFSLETYDREIERYGGLEATLVTEAIYCADSRAVAELLRSVRARDVTLDLLELAVVTMDDYLDSFGMPLRERLALCETLGVSRRMVAAEYRERQPRLHHLLSTRAESKNALATILARRRSAFEIARGELDGLVAQGKLETRMADLFRSYLHLHCNRLLGRDRDAERRATALLMRTYEGLVRRSAGAAEPS